MLATASALAAPLVPVPALWLLVVLILAAALGLISLFQARSPTGDAEAGSGTGLAALTVAMIGTIVLVLWGFVTV